MDPDTILEILAAWPDGISEALLRAHGLHSTTLADLIGARLVTATVERVLDGGKEVEIMRIRITGKGRTALKR